MELGRRCRTPSWWRARSGGVTARRTKLRILQEADACTQPGEVGALLRREGLYTSVAWTVQYRELGKIAEALIAQACEQQRITREQLTLHADRGIPMRSKPVTFLLADLGVLKTHSRPYTSSDNPYSEAQFKTLKYRPEFPERFDSIEHAREHCQHFFHWYNHEHNHSGIGLMTPAAVHYREAQRLYDQRADVLAAAYARNPERFVRKPPVPPELPAAVWINKPEDKEVAH